MNQNDQKIPKRSSVDNNQKELVFSWEDVYVSCYKICEQIQKKKKCFKTLLAVSRGGLVPAGIISYLLDIKDVRTISIETYSRKTKKRNVNEIIQAPNFYLFAGKEILVVDDVLDTGKTYAVIRRLMKPILTSSYLSLAVLCHKNIAPHPDFFSSVEKETWIHFPWEK